MGSGNTAIVLVRRGGSSAGAEALRRAMRERAVDAACNVLAAQFRLEALEPRRMLSAAAAAPAAPAVEGALATVSFPGYSGFAIPSGVGMTSDGKMYVIADVAASANDDPTQAWQERWGLARLNADGSPDTTFGPDGTGSEVISLGDDDSYPQQLIMQPDGKLVVTGDSPSGFVIGRFNADGSVDKSFNGGLKAYDALGGFDENLIWARQAAWLTGDGKVMVSGQEGEDFVTMRLNADGTPDESYGPDGLVRAPVTAAESAGLGTIDHGALLDVYRLNSGGGIAYVDVWFNGAAGVAGDVEQQAAPQIFRLQFDDNGQLISQRLVDVALANSGDVNYDYFLTFAEDGSAFVSTEQPDPRVEKLTPAGEADPTFGVDGVVTVPGRYAITDAPTADGGVLVQYGNESTMDLPNANAELQLGADGSIETNFNGGQPLLDGGADLSMQWPDGSFLFGAEGGDYGDEATLELSRFLADGGPADTLLPPDVTAAIGDPAAFGGLFHGPADAAGVAVRGMFTAAVDGSVWNPDGTQDVWA